MCDAYLLLILYKQPPLFITRYSFKQLSEQEVHTSHKTRYFPTNFLCNGGRTLIVVLRRLSTRHRGTFGKSGALPARRFPRQSADPTVHCGRDTRDLLPSDRRRGRANRQGAGALWDWNVQDPFWKYNQSRSISFPDLAQSRKFCRVRKFSTKSMNNLTNVMSQE